MTKTRSAETSFQVPLEIVQSSRFGRWPKISDEYTYNMFIADDALINFAGYNFILSLKANGRGLFSSEKSNLMFAVSEGTVYQINSSFLKVPVVQIGTVSGDVTIDEDDINNVAFCDGSNIYIYNYVTGINYISGLPYGSFKDASTVSQSGTTVTGSGSTFTTAMTGGTIYFADGTSSIIQAVGSTTSLTVSVSASKSSQNYLIIYAMDFVPNYVTFHDGRFIATSSVSAGVQVGQWRLSQTILVGSISYIVFPATAQFVGAFQTKPDLPIGVVRLPGRSNQILILGSEVAEPWTDYGLTLFPYLKNKTFNIDFGVINPATIATLNNLVVWIGRNERSGPMIMYTTGEDVKIISTDGIDFLFERLKFPTQCYGMAYMQSGHLFYIFTFYNPADNLTLTYDFKTGKFYNLTDENNNFFVAKKVVFFNFNYYFISINDGNIYQLDSTFTTYQYPNAIIKQIPRSRILKTFEVPSTTGEGAISNDLYFIVEQGIDTEYTGQGNDIEEINVTAGGSGYTVANVVIEGDGSFASATANLINIIQSFSVQALVDAPTVISITVSALVNAPTVESISLLASGIFGVVGSVTLNNPGIGYTWSVTTITGDGSGAFAEPLLNVTEYTPRVQISVSYDSGYGWSGFDTMPVNVLGKFKNRFYYNNLGYGNEFTYQFRFEMYSRFVCKNGMSSYYR